jgi:hypothetical protein
VRTTLIAPCRSILKRIASRKCSGSRNTVAVSAHTTSEANPNAASPISQMRAFLAWRQFPISDLTATAYPLCRGVDDLQPAKISTIEPPIAGKETVGGYQRVGARFLTRACDAFALSRAR